MHLFSPDGFSTHIGLPLGNSLVHELAFGFPGLIEIVIIGLAEMRTFS